MPTNEEDDPKAARAAFIFQLYFFYHVFGQMVAQVLMLIATGAKIQFDNRHLLNPYNKERETIHVSSHLWYMLVAGYIMPVCGILTFFLVTYYWTQEFPIGVLIDMLQILGKADKLCPNDSIEDWKEKFNTVEKYLNLAEMNKNFQKMQKGHLCHKFLYPFQSPLIVILCMAYIGCQLGFFICAAVTVDENGQLVGIYLNGGGWVIYYYLTLLLVSLANVYAVLVAVVWLIVIAVVIVLVIPLVVINIVYFIVYKVYVIPLITMTADGQ